MLLVGLCGKLKVMNIKNHYSGPPSACVCYADIWVKFDKFVTLFETENRGRRIVHFLVFVLPFKSWQLLFDTKKAAELHTFLVQSLLLDTAFLMHRFIMK